MEKKEPILNTSDTQTSAPKTEERKEVANTKPQKQKTSFKDKVKAKYKKVKETKMSDKQKKLLIAILIFIIIIGITIWVISLFNTDKANVATLEPAKVEKQVVKEEKQSWWSKLFSKSEDKKDEIIYPSFDIVRMEKGEAVIAGQAKAGDIVHILDNDHEIGTETADENGQWVFIPKKALPVGNRKLSLYVLNDKGKKIKSKQSAILHVSQKSNDEVAVIMGDNKKSKVLKAPKGQKIGALRIEKIDYNDKGDFHTEGKAAKNTKINLYMNNKLIATTTSDKSGNWSVDTTYKLSDKKQVIRADMLSSGCKVKVVKRVEYKFTPVLIDGENSMVVVKKGDCLWNLALKEYGKGTNYVVIFEANKSQIKDPNKIYVGQVFTMVKKNSEKFTELKEKAIIEKKKRK
ncbi:LysM peptidoglycan-binding domain-containing protein [bacterium]|nr:LysM peptidoglycan-binding domain-containing protein [bacterium]